MHYFKKLISIVFFIILTTQTTHAFYHQSWKDIYNSILGIGIQRQEDVSQISIDLDSVNIHNDSIYYAVLYYHKSKNSKYLKSYVSIIQSKNNKAGIVVTYDADKYDKMMHNHCQYEHPAYTAGNAKELKEIKNDSFIYDADNLAKEAVKAKRYNPASLNLHNGLYGI